MNMKIKAPRPARERGNALLEFAVVFPCITILFFGSAALGVMLGRYIQCVQVCRDVAHIYADKNLDLSTTKYKNIVTQNLASGVGMTNSGGNGVVILSRIITVFSSDCTANGIVAGSCTNKDKPVLTQRIVIGNAALRSSAFGTPPNGMTDSQGNITAANYMTNAALQATGF